MTQRAELNVVTGAFSYTGKYIARELLARGKSVRTLARRPDSGNIFVGRVAAFPLNFDRPEELEDSLRGATTLYNTYWVRFPRGEVTFDRAVENTRALLRAAVAAGVQRIVHLSVANASETSPLPYFRGKGRVEAAIISSGLSYAILRPGLTFGVEDILLNNIAWLLRRFPLFVIGGTGEYRMHPVYAGDLAEQAATAGESTDSFIADAVGPEALTFNEMVRLIAEKVRSRATVIHVHPELALFLSRLVGYLVGDVALTRQELEALAANLLASTEPPTGRTRLGDWLDENRDSIGVRYTSELRRHFS